jgi:hypothetical protein
LIDETSDLTLEISMLEFYTNFGSTAGVLSVFGFEDTGVKP